MPAVTDALGRTWTLILTVGVQSDVRAATEVDLFRLFDADFSGLNALLEDPPRLVQVLFAWLARQARAAGVDERSFADGFDGDALDRFAHALIDACVDFSPRHKRTALQRLVTLARQLQTTAAAQAIENLHQLEARLLGATSSANVGDSADGPA